MDTESLLKSLNAHNVRCVVIGAIAFPIHGYARATLDVDILIEATIENAQRTHEALSALGYDLSDVSVDELRTKKVLIRHYLLEVDVHPFARVDETVAPIVAENRGVYLEIEGHTDASGPGAYNLKLREDRAMAVRNYLHDQHQIVGCACRVSSPEEAAARRSVVTDWLEAVDLVLLQRLILARASEPFPTALGTLDALHLATALVWRDRMQETLVMATHDTSLGLAARSFDMDVLGG